MNDPEPTTTAQVDAQIDEAEKQSAIAMMKAKLSSSADKPPLMLSTTAQDRAATAPRWTASQWATKRRRRKTAAQSRRRNR